MSTITLNHASCLDWLAEYDGPLFDSCVTDPPYHLTSIVKRFGGKNAAEAKVGATGAYARASKGFMGKEWDGGDIAFRPETWRAVYDALKPGAHLVAFSGTRTYHRMACAIEDAGFEIRDQLFWHYASGFPKSHNISKALCDIRCNCEQTESTPERNLRPVPISDVSEAVSNENQRGQILHTGLPKQSASQLGGKGAKSKIARREQSGVEGRGDVEASAWELQGRPLCESAGMGAANGAERPLYNGTSVSHGADVRIPNDANGSGESHRPQPEQQSPEQSGTVADECGSQAWGGWPVCGGCSKPIIPEGLGTALKPSTEPICLARKPLSEKSIAANVLKHGTGAINIDGCRVGSEGGTRKEANADKSATASVGGYLNAKAGAPIDAGRWPANLLTDGSDEVLAGFPYQKSGENKPAAKEKEPSVAMGNFAQANVNHFGPSEGSAARFFYSAKAGPLDRIGTAHATVKPVDVMRWLCRLVTPPGGHILEPFAGSGTTGIAAMAEGFDCTMIELEADHVADIERKLAFLRGEGALTFQEHNHAKSLRAKPEPLGGLFSGNMDAPPPRNAVQAG